MNEKDNFHICSFNLAFVGSGVSIFTSQVMELDPIDGNLPISEINLHRFLNQSKISINEIKSLSGDDFITKYIETATSLKAEQTSTLNDLSLFFLY